MYRRIFYQGMGYYSPRVRQDLDLVPWGIFHRALAPANHNAARGVGGSTHGEAVSTQGSSGFVPRVLKLYLYGRTHDPAMGPYRPWVPLAA